MKKLLALIFIATVCLGAACKEAAPAARNGSEWPVTPSSRYARKWVQDRDWGLKNIKVTDAWSLEQGKRSIRVAVIDTGVQADHPALGNAVVGGWDFVENHSGTTDVHGHGTHIAGIIRSIADVTIVPYRYYSDKPTSNNMANTIKAIYKAVDDGCQIINYSGGGNEFSEPEFLAVRYARDHGVLVVAAAGNEHSDTDKKPYYPADYGLSNVISVGNVDIKGQLVSSSNYGAKTVQVVAPGENIYSALPNDNYGYMTGTSQATAVVSGIAALILSKNPTLTPAIVKMLLETTSDSLESIRGKASAGRVNAYDAVHQADLMLSRQHGLYAKRPKMVEHGI